MISNPKSIRFQLLAWNAGVMLFFFLCFCWFVFLSLGTYLENNLRSNLTRRATQIAAHVLTTPEAAAAEGVASRIQNLFSPEKSGRLVRITENGRLVYHSGVPLDNAFTPSEVPKLLPTASPSFKKLSLESGELFYIWGMPVREEGRNFFLEVGASGTPLQEVMDQTLLAMTVSAPIALGLAMGGALLLLRRAMNPLAKVAVAAEKITLRNLNETIPLTNSGDELERLTKSLNHMVARLNNSFTDTRRFIADASHELRTPLTIIRGELEGVLRRGKLRPADSEAVGSCLEEAERLTKIVEALFALSRLDAGEAQAERVSFDLAQLVRNTAEQMFLLAADKDIEMECDCVKPVPVEGDRARLKQVIVNLIDNAVKYTPARGKITIRTDSFDRSALLEIRDTGIGIPEAAVPHVFKRFYRVDKARSRELGGAGLGLAIVHSICEAHGAQINVMSTEGMGTTFRLVMPLSKAESQAEPMHRLRPGLQPPVPSI